MLSRQNLHDISLIISWFLSYVSASMSDSWNTFHKEFLRCKLSTTEARIVRMCFVYTNSVILVFRMFVGTIKWSLIRLLTRLLSLALRFAMRCSLPMRWCNRALTMHGLCYLPVNGFVLSSQSAYFRYESLLFTWTWVSQAVVLLPFYPSRHLFCLLI